MKYEYWHIIVTKQASGFDVINKSVKEDGWEVWQATPVTIDVGHEVIVGAVYFLRKEVKDA